MQGWEIITPSGLRSVGSGIIINPDGYVLTNYHVVALGNNIRVSLFETQQAGNPGQPSYKDYPAQIVAAEPDNDLALLKIISNNQFVYAPIGDSDRVRVGDKVIGIGNPFGLTQTVTSGIISAKRDKLPIGGIFLRNVFQLDVPINPGNSGGALVNTLGEIIGVNTAIYSPADSIYTGVSFAIPINQAVALFGKYFDVAAKPANFRAIALQQQPQQNALGLGQNNYLAIQGNKVGPSQTPVLNTGVPPTVFVQGNRVNPVPGQPAPPPINVLVNKIQPSPGEGIEEIAWLGIDLVPDNDANTTTSEIEVDEIEGITPMEAGLQAGDILKKINGYPTRNMYELKEVLKKIPLETGQGIVLEIERERNGQYKYISFKLHNYDLKGR
jgi:S1-C subfamily serine protease